MLAGASMLLAANKNPVPLSKDYDAPIEKVYASVVQVASADYNMIAAINEGHAVSFFTGGQASLVLNAICREDGANRTAVSISVSQAVGNPQIFFVAKAKDKEVVRFWTELDKAIQINQAIKTDSGKHQPSENSAKDELAQLTVKSTPDGADIIMDGKFAGSTPSTFQIKSGDHSVRVELNGFVPWEKSLTITAGGQITLNANLQRKTTDAPQ